MGNIGNRDKIEVAACARTTYNIDESGCRGFFRVHIRKKAYSVLGLAWGQQHSGCNSRLSYIGNVETLILYSHNVFYNVLNAGS